MLGKAAVTIWCDVAHEARDEFDDWHAHEHMQERLSIPGFRRGSRWVADEGDGYFMLYEAKDEATITSGPYLERLNAPTPWSRKMMPHHRNMARSLCRVEAAFGSGLGQALLTVRFSPDPGRADQLLAWLKTEMLPGLPARKGLIGAGTPSCATATSSSATTPTAPAGAGACDAPCRTRTWRASFWSAPAAAARPALTPCFGSARKT
jgi:hypothetical protein